MDERRIMKIENTVILVVCAFIGITASAEIYNFNYDFTGVDNASSDWVLVGNSSWQAGSLQLTLTSEGQIGTAFHNDNGILFDASLDWTFSYSGKISDIGAGNGGDGMGFALIDSEIDLPADPVFWNGRDNSFVLNLDTYYNDAPGNPWHDPVSTASSIEVFTDASSGPVYSVSPSDSGYFDSNDGIFSFTIAYDASLTQLDIDYQLNGGTVEEYGTTVDLRNLDSVYLAFQGVTGAATETHEVLSVSGTFTRAIPEPSTMMLLGLGPAALLAGRKRFLSRN